MLTILKILVLTAHQPEPRLMHERGRLEGLSGRLLRHLLGRQLAEFVVNQREQLVGGLGFTPRHSVEDAGDIAHEGNLTETSPKSIPEDRRKTRRDAE